MKKRTLNQTWILCLRMWRYISKRWAEGMDIRSLKILWFHDNGFMMKDIEAGCFFCDYCNEETHCRNCPGRLVDPSFDCFTESYDFRTEPVAFYQELLRLNRIRKGRK